MLKLDENINSVLNSIFRSVGNLCLIEIYLPYVLNKYNIKVSIIK